MDENKRGHREHVLREPLEQSIRAALESGSSSSDVVETVLKTLNSQRMIMYSAKDEISLITPAGRVLVAMLEDPEITQRALSVYLGVTESNIHKAVKTLVDSELIAKTKVKGRNKYQINKKRALEHPDISRLIYALHAQRMLEPQTPKDITEEEDPF
jgi:hypothetical protein